MSTPKKTNSPTEKRKEHLCLKGFKFKETEEGDIIITGLAATTHPDRVGDILSERVIQQVVDNINNTNTVGDESGAYRSVSLHHDWVTEQDPTKDEVGFIQPTARKITLPDGHYAAEIDVKLNKFYNADMSLDEVKYRIENKQIAGFSIEYDTDDAQIREVEHNGETFNFINELSEFGGVGLARARKIANPKAVIYKEVVDGMKAREDTKMSDEDEAKLAGKESEADAEAKKKKAEEDAEAEKKKTAETKETKSELDIKEITAKVVAQAKEELDVANKVIKQTKESVKKMEETKEIPLSVKEMNDSIKGGKIDMMKFKEATSTYFAENPKMDAKLKEQFLGHGIPLRPTLQVKCHNNKLHIVSPLKIKSSLDLDTNAGAYTESIVEFADLFIPGLIETFNNQTNLFGALRKVNHLMGGNMYGWKIKTDQATSLSVDPDDTSVLFNPVDKLKLRTEIKEYRVGVSVTDYVMHHARATMGDLLMLEAEARMGDMMRDINNDLFTEQVDTAGNKILGLEAVADSAGNTEMYNKTRSTTNRLSPTAAADTYTEVGGALTTVYVRTAARKPEIEGARRENLRYVTNPTVRDYLFELEDGNQRYFTAARLGFEGQISYDGIPVIVDSSCQTDALYCIDWESYYIVMSRAPQLIGLAKVGAADSAYISVYLAAVYEQPRRIHMLNTITS